MVRVLRSKKDASLLKAFGYVDEGGLGVFNEKKWEEVELEELPKDFRFFKDKEPAMGVDLVKSINQATIKTLNDEEAFNLVEKLVPFLLCLEQARCNPMSKETLKTLLKLFREKIVNGQKQALLELISEWRKNKKFADDSDEDDD